jgi:hypothetical protein
VLKRLVVLEKFTDVSEMLAAYVFRVMIILIVEVTGTSETLVNFF